MSVCTPIAIGIAPGTAPGELLDEHDAGREIATAAAPARRVVEPEESKLAASPEQRVGKRAGSLPLLDVGPHLGVDEAANRGTQLVVLGREDGMAHHR